MLATSTWVCSWGRRCMKATHITVVTTGLRSPPAAQHTMGLSSVCGAALVTILGVLVVIAASVTLFPTRFGYPGRTSTGCGCRSARPPATR
jgi:hypothetical protein